ncbi:hypothetical protein [Larkinella rosea]|uniref:DUF4369 domain-containing protein n=1 Tax=Larkinella rosea TaxID=2025312 RepID=A0A3P1C3L8_9BACT|nr:hypothetical protein [Larkinella rosea]RRB07414.1 hypothetical protein EHT25_06440 [Larkinella rosea]
MNKLAARYGFLLSLLVSGLTAKGQTIPNVTRDLLNQGAYLKMSNYDVTPIYTMAGPEGKILGYPYLDTTFAKTTVVFYQNIAKPGSKPILEIPDTPVRYNITANDLEFLMDTKTVKAISGERAKLFKMERNGETMTFINATEVGAPVDVRGFFEQLNDGKLKLLIRHQIYVKKPTYNPALSVGTKDTELIKEAIWYTGDGKKLAKFSPGRKGLLSAMQDKEDQISAYLKEKKPDLKNRQALIDVFTYYNTL